MDRPPSRTRTRREALIVAHGQPSAPEPAEADLARLAGSVAGALPGWRIAAATLAAPGALDRALAALDAPLVFPLFMADGWFLRDLLPRRLADAGLAAPRILKPFGLMPGTQACAAAIVAGALAEAGWRAEDTSLLLAAHGSGRSRFPAAAAARTAEALGRALPLRSIATGFLEEDPRLGSAAQGLGQRALCLPLFVARWSHVVEDVPSALAGAGFAGRLLPPLGDHASVPKLIAAALAAG
ncbi:MAG: cobalamin biosynthesis protein CbiX [Defluviimonas sp.]|uniref:sirohydrochlorin chelatase n=1 Tax=Albidovulum sp. TaxID=1872424 RepID=UPI001D5D46CE|nr:cobalamin biosynthesis protein CbiX [Paracoccaceae bacterium]MCC0064347.1 cobalamin biosynthesis protein CbiX [Defluviimonas sp.]